ncbi:MAG TPA: hypothetical protein PKZ60_03860 [Candidatus Saccharicenans sp.]|jgi:nitrate reductase gamma subunit|nr:hypothetical protein [Candidatus Saccharicenans sp.]HPU93564.1 hypothetical protein [Candidatus Saccharicenans sp.]
MDWTEILRFSRGPLFHFSLVIFIAGMIYRLVRIIFLGWEKDRVKSQGSKLSGVIISYLKGLIILPFIPWVRRTFKNNALTFIAGGIFHLSLFLVLIFGAAHILVWQSLFGVSWAPLPTPVVDWVAAAGIVSLIILLINRLTHPVLRLLTKLPAWINWTLVFLPFVTGYIMYHHLWFPYEVIFSLHLIFVCLLLIWIPFSRMSHFLFYFFSRTIHGARAGKRAVTP